LQIYRLNPNYVHAFDISTISPFEVPTTIRFPGAKATAFTFAPTLTVIYRL